MALVYYLEDLAGNTLGELPGAYDKTVVPEPINTMATAGFKVPLDHPDADFLLAGDALIRVDETHVPGADGPVTRFHGRLITADEVAGQDGKGSVAVAAADGFWTLLRRLIGKSARGYNYGGPFTPGGSVGSIDYTILLADIVNAANLEAASGVIPGNLTFSRVYSYADGWRYAAAGEKIAELAATLDGPDFRVRSLAKVIPGARLPAPTGLTVTGGGGPSTPSQWAGYGSYLDPTTNTYAVTAIDANGVESPPSADVTTTSGSGPGTFYNRFFELSWNPVPGAVSYRIYRRAVSPQGSNPIAVSAGAPGFTRWALDTWGNIYTGQPVAGTATSMSDAGGYWWNSGDVPPVGSGPYVGGFYNALDVAPVLGSVKLDAAFEYGDGLLNVASYQRGVSLDGTINRGYHLPPGFPDNATQAVLMQEDTASQAARGLLEAVVTGDVSVDDLRTKLLQYHIAVRKQARQVITFVPVTGIGSRGPRYGVDYVAGDVVPFRASYLSRAGKRVKRVDALFRIYQVALSVDELGNATPAVTVTPS